MTITDRRFLNVARLAAKLADEKKGEDILLLDVRRNSTLTQFILLATVESHPQMQAIINHVIEQMRENYDLRPLHRDGVGSPQWTVIDYGGLVMHLFHKNARAFYGLERLWEDARRVKWDASARAKARA